MGRLDRYVGVLFLSSYATAFFILVGLFMIVDMASNLDGFLRRWEDGSSAPLMLVVRYYILQVPFVFLQLAPFVTLVAGLFSASRLLKSNEVIAALGAGVSTQRVLLFVFVGAVLSGIGMFALREVASATLARQRERVKYVLDNQRYDEVYTDVWSRTLDGYLIHIGEFRPESESSLKPDARGVQEIDVTNKRWTTTEAPEAVFEERGGRYAWWLKNGMRRQVRGSDVRQPAERLESGEFTPALALAFHRATENPMDLSYSEVRELARRDPYNVVYKTLIQHHVTYSLANLVLLLVGLPILMRHDRTRAVDRLAFACLLCIFYFASDFVLTNLGLQGGIDPTIAAWLPIVFFGSIGVASFGAMRT